MVSELFNIRALLCTLLTCIFNISEELEQIPSVHSHLYLHASENPTTTIVSPFLDSTHYHSCSRSISIACSAKNIIEFVNGSAP